MYEETYSHGVRSSVHHQEVPPRPRSATPPPASPPPSPRPPSTSCPRATRSWTSPPSPPPPPSPTRRPSSSPAGPDPRAGIRTGPTRPPHLQRRPMSEHTDHIFAQSPEIQALPAHE